jgi:hypothetical protein
MKQHSTITTNTLKLPEGGIIEAFREGTIGPRLRTFSLRHKPEAASPESEHRLFHSKSALPQVAVDYLGLTARIIKPEKIIIPAELLGFWREKIASSPELGDLTWEVAR